MKKRIRTSLYVIAGIAVFWTALTIWAEVAGKQQVKEVVAEEGNLTALILYNPDPIYNLDEQVCISFAEGLQELGISSKIVTNKKASQFSEDTYDLYVFCANTYNFSPDRGILKAIDKFGDLEGQPVVAITLGSGSTDRSQRKFEEFLNDKKVNLLRSRTYWLMRPNDESKMEESNIKIAVDLSKELALSLSQEAFLHKH